MASKIICKVKFIPVISLKNIFIGRRFNKMKALTVCSLVKEFDNTSQETTIASSTCCKTKCTLYWQPIFFTMSLKCLFGFHVESSGFRVNDPTLTEIQIANSISLVKLCQKQHSSLQQVCFGAIRLQKMHSNRFLHFLEIWAQNLLSKSCFLLWLLFEGGC